MEMNRNRTESVDRRKGEKKKFEQEAEEAKKLEDDRSDRNGIERTWTPVNDERGIGFEKIMVVANCKTHTDRFNLWSGIEKYCREVHGMYSPLGVGGSHQFQVNV